MNNYNTCYTLAKEAAETTKTKKKNNQSLLHRNKINNTIELMTKEARKLLEYLEINLNAEKDSITHNLLNTKIQNKLLCLNTLLQEI